MQGVLRLAWQIRVSHGGAMSVLLFTASVLKLFRSISYHFQQL